LSSAFEESTSNFERFRKQERRTPAPDLPEENLTPDVPVGEPTPSGTPYVRWDLHRDYVTDEEKVRWTEEGIEQNYDQQIRVEMSRARMAGSPIDREEALRRVMLKSVGTTVSPQSGDAYLSPTNVKERTPANSDEVKDYIALNYPSITRAAYESGMTEAEILLTANVMVARDAAAEIYSSYNPVRQAQIFNTMGPDMQELVATIYGRMIEQGQEQSSVIDEQSGGNAITDTGRKIWGYTLGPALDAAWDANQFTVNRVVPTLAYTVGGFFSGRDPIESVTEFFPATAPNAIDPGAVKIAREKYGDKTVDVILELMGAKINGEDDAIGKIIQKYYEADDVEALDIIDNLLSGNPTSQEIQDAETYLSSARMGNLGNIMFWSVADALGVNPLSNEGIKIANTPLLTGIRDTSNILGSFIFDPTLGFSKFNQGYRAARFGLHKLGPGGSIEKVFQNKQTRNAFDAFGKSLQYVDDAKDQTIAAQRLNTVNSQWKNFFTPEAIQSMRQAGVRDADTAYEFFRSAENLTLMISGQMARRGNKILIPHMSKATAELKLLNMKARGFTYDRRAAQRLDSLFNAPVSQMLPEEAIPYIINQLGSKDGEKFLGRMMSDFVFANDTARRTFLGKVFDLAIKRDPGNPRLLRAIDRYGFKRERGARRFIERRGRIMAHMPDVARISISDGKDAYKIRDLMLYGGMPKYWADYAAMTWRQMNPGQRMQFATGMGRSVAYARGVDVVDPVNGKRLIDDLTSGFRPGELYAPDQMDLVALRGMAERLADDVLAGKTQIEGVTAATGKGSSLGIAAARQELDSLKRARDEMVQAGTPATDDSLVAVQKQIDSLEDFVKNTTRASKDERKALIKEIMDDLKAKSPMFNPSRVVDQGQDVTRGLYRNQFADQISFINFEKLDEFSMRQSYLSALLGANPFMTRATDVWTLGTLAGPRFQVRNGIEDAIFYGITNGNWKAYRYGQLVSRAKIEATARPESAKKVAAIEAGVAEVRGGKLGTVPTLTRWLGDHLPKTLNGIVLPHLSSKEIALAQKAGQDGNRKVLGDLIQKALLRQRLFFLGPKASRNKQYIQDLDDIYDSGYFWGTYDDAAEAARHLVDGVLPGADNTMVVNGQVVKTVSLSRDFKSIEYTSDPDHVRAWWNNLSMILHGDGNKGAKSVSMLSRYYKAKRSGDPAKVREVVQEYADWLQENAKWLEGRSGIVATEGIESFAQRNLDDVLRVFSTKSGTFNYELFKKIRKVEVDPKTGEKKITYALWDDVDGKTVYRLDETDLIKMKGRPQTVLDMESLSVPVTDGIPMNTRIWSMMGRSYARLTRQPMFIANYLDARDVLRPIERRIAAEMGEEYAKKWAANAGTERAFNTLISYVDNPAIRSQLAFNLRNVARFYRALEDFNRRALRAVKNYPEGIQKINLSYRILDDTGFVNENEFGEKTFVWPGSRQAIQAITGVANKFGVNVNVMGGLPISFSSSITNLTPSADPDGWTPTFSGWYASAAVRPLMRITPGLSSLEEEFFGVYGQRQAVWETVLPTNLARPLNYIIAASQGGVNEEGEINRWATGAGAFASANKTAIQAAVAAGWIDPNEEYSNEELMDIQRRIDQVGMDILLFRVGFGPVIPAAFRVQSENVSNFAKELGISSLRSAYIQLLRQYDGDADQALIAWMRMNPDQSIFTVGTSTNAQNMGWYEPFGETVDFIENNKEVVDKYPVGSALFSPQIGKQQLSAWNYLRAMGVTVSKSSTKYFNEMATSKGYILYRIYKKQYEDILATGTEEEIADAKRSWTAAKEDLKLTYPLLDSRLSGQLSTAGKFSSQDDYRRDVDEYKGAVAWFEERNQLDERGREAKKVLAYHDEAKLKLSEFTQNDPNYNKNKTKIRESWMRMIEDMRSKFPDDDAFESLLYTTSGSLGFRLD